VFSSNVNRLLGRLNGVDVTDMCTKKKSTYRFEILKLEANAILGGGLLDLYGRNSQAVELDERRWVYLDGIFTFLQT
jgi:hypothetical protein